MTGDFTWAFLDPVQKRIFDHLLLLSMIHFFEGVFVGVFWVNSIFSLLISLSIIFSLFSNLKMTFISFFFCFNRYFFLFFFLAGLIFIGFALFFPFFPWWDLFVFRSFFFKLIMKSKPKTQKNWTQTQNKYKTLQKGKKNKKPWKLEKEADNLLNI